jgi:nitrilase
MPQTLNVAAIQMVSTPDVTENLATAAALVAEAASAGAELVLLPEYFCLIGHHDHDKLRHAETPGHGPIQDTLAALARQHQLWLIGGTLPLAVEGDPSHVWNSSLVFDPQGQQVARYDKIHLFRFDDGQRRYEEAATLQAGQHPVAFNATTRSGLSLRVGLSICYDLRFPELYRQLMRPPCDLLLLPAAFTDVTGRAHWELLLRARAVENQCYMLAAGQGGLHPNGRRTWGHSMLVEPWGQINAIRPEGPGVVLGTLDLSHLHHIRNRLPALEHRVL